MIIIEVWFKLKNEIELIMIDRTLCSMWQKLNRTTMWLIIKVRSLSKMKLNNHDRSDSLELFIAFRAHNLRPEVIYVIHSPELFITSRALSSWPGVIYVNYRPKLFLTFRALSSWPGVIHVIYSLKLFVAFRGLSLWRRIVHVIRNP